MSQLHRNLVKIGSLVSRSSLHSLDASLGGSISWLHISHRRQDIIVVFLLNDGLGYRRSIVGKRQPLVTRNHNLRLVFAIEATRVSVSGGRGGLGGGGEFCKLFELRK